MSILRSAKEIVQGLYVPIIILDIASYQWDGVSRKPPWEVAQRHVTSLAGRVDLLQNGISKDVVKQDKPSPNWMVICHDQS